MPNNYTASFPKNSTVQKNYFLSQFSINNAMMI